MLILEREYRDAPGTPVEQTRWQAGYLTSLLENRSWVALPPAR
jgi:hypothetical protein